MKEITLTFDVTTGEVQVEAHGFKGSSCQDATKFLKDTLGKMTDFQRKAEWYEKSLELQSQGIGVFVNSNFCG